MLRKILEMVAFDCFQDLISVYLEGPQEKLRCHKEVKQKREYLSSADGQHWVLCEPK